MAVDTITITPEHICADSIVIEVEDGVIRSVTFEGGCDGNGKALGRLLRGMPAEQAVRLLKGVDCDGKGTSCADQFARGLAERMKLPE